MSDITMEKKLQLISQVRSRYRHDQSDLLHREQLLYGKTSIDRLRREAKNPYGYSPNRQREMDEEFMEYDPYNELGEGYPDGVSGAGPFRIRLFAALVAFLLILALDKNGRDLFGFSTEQIFHSIAKDYVTDAENMFQSISFTLGGTKDQ